MKWIFGILIIVFQLQLNAQGTLLSKGESGTSFGYSTFKVTSSSAIFSNRAHSAYFGFAIKRRIELEFEAGRFLDNTLLGLAFSGFLDFGGGLAFKPSFIYSRFAGNGANAFGGSFFAGSDNNSKFVPRAGFVRTFEGQTNYTIGADLLLGVGYAGVTSGITLIIDGSDTSLVVLSFGVLFNDRKRQLIPK